MFYFQNIIYDLFCRFMNTNSSELNENLDLALTFPLEIICEQQLEKQLESSLQ